MTAPSTCRSDRAPPGTCIVQGVDPVAPSRPSLVPAHEPATHPGPPLTQAPAGCWKNVPVDEAASPAGESVAGDFTLVCELGRGSSSVVHLARQRSLDREVALKRLLRTLSGDPAASARLRREGQVISRLVHPHIVRLYDLIEDGADLVLVMEYVRGPSVRSLGLASPPSPGQALAVVVDVATALDYAAARDVVHRDVKPANVFVTAAGRCKLGDFGLARITGERMMFQSNDGTVRGTPFYMAPEQLRGADPSPAWDVYALALMALELLSRQHPFEGMTIRGAIEAHLDGGAMSAALTAPLPKSIVEVLRDGLAPNAADRPTARELADRLVRAAPGSWFEKSPAGERREHTTSPTVGVSTSVEKPSEGLWAAGDHGGWTMEEVVDDATWIGSDPAFDRLPPTAPVSDPSPVLLREELSLAQGQSVSEMTHTTIDDQWIRHLTPDLATHSTGRVKRTWVVIMAAFVIGFALALAAVELLHH
jgi:serine/threonine protein kinase